MTDSIRRQYNELAEKYGWKTIPKGKAPPHRRMAQQLKDLKDCIEAGIVTRMTTVQPQENWDGVVRKAPMSKKKEGAI